MKFRTTDRLIFTIAIPAYVLFPFADPFDAEEVFFTPRFPPAGVCSYRATGLVAGAVRYHVTGFVFNDKARIAVTVGTVAQHAGCLWWFPQSLMILQWNRLWSENCWCRLIQTKIISIWGPCSTSRFAGCCRIPRCTFDSATDSPTDQAPVLHHSPQ